VNEDAHYKWVETKIIGNLDEQLRRKKLRKKLREKAYGTCSLCAGKAFFLMKIRCVREKPFFL